jgi:hypothetical protein
MAQRVNLDAMIRREDFGVTGEEYTLDLFKDFPIANLEQGNPIFRLLRKPDFQRETNHWSPEQIATFIESFVDNEVIPGLILWKAPNLIFVLDGGHRLSAVRAWMENDYGDGPITAAFYKGEISNDQKKAAKRARTLIESRVGRYQTLRQLVGSQDNTQQKTVQRATRAFTRSLSLQWVQGSASVAESSFFKINSQGTPLDSTETTLIKQRRKPIGISARAILRAGTGNKYWAIFPPERQLQLEDLAKEFFELLFEPEADIPIKTLDLRAQVEKFLMDNKSWLSSLQRNMSRNQRISKTRDLLMYLVSDFNAGKAITPEGAVAHLGLRGRFFDAEGTKGTKFSDDAKSMAFLQAATQSALKCPICTGMLDPRKSVSYDHKIRVRDGGKGGAANAQLAHPYCNTAVKN